MLIYLYYKEKTCFFVRLSARQHFTFSVISRKVLSTPPQNKIIIVIGLKNSKEGSWKEKIWII